MKNLIAVLFILSTSFSAYAQFGVAVKYEKNNYREWAGLSLSENDLVFKNDLTIGANYWFRLKNKRIEFLPELSYTLKNTEVNIDGVVATTDFEMGLSRIGFQFNTQIYPLDFEGDCNCPTWGKDNEFLKKGLFFTLAPGLDYFVTDLTYEGVSQSVDNFVSFKIGVGGGVDIGISNLMTISPFVLVNFYPSVNGTMINDFFTLECPTCEVIDRKTLNTQISAGIRLHFRPDYKY